jgi:hypothetical protein
MKSIIILVAIVFVASAAQGQRLQYTREQVLQYAPQAQRWTASQWREFDRATQCAYRNTNRLRAGGDPRAFRLFRALSQPRARRIVPAAFADPTRTQGEAVPVA